MPSIKRSTALAHIACWLLFVSLPFFFALNMLQTSEGFRAPSVSAVLLFGLLFPSVFYIHTYILAPRFFYKKKYVQYSLAVLVIVVAVLSTRPFDHLHRTPDFKKGKGPLHHVRTSAPTTSAFRDSGKPSPPPDMDDGEHHHGPLIDFVSLFLLIIVITVSFALIIAKQWKVATQKAAQAETDKANAELSFLKAQINPHFLFNTLNNIYSLAMSKSDATPDAVMKLSNIMRYVTDEAHQTFVPLQSEIDCLLNYIELQRMRLGKKVTLDLRIDQVPQGRVIAPLILITFVENLFKYGLSNHEASVLTLHLTISDAMVTLVTRNKINQAASHHGSSGIGIANTRKRLQHLYDGKHLLNIVVEGDIFNVELILFE